MAAILDLRAQYQNWLAEKRGQRLERQKEQLLRQAQPVSPPRHWPPTWAAGGQTTLKPPDTWVMPAGSRPVKWAAWLSPQPARSLSPRWRAHGASYSPRGGG